MQFHRSGRYMSDKGDMPGRMSMPSSHQTNSLHLNPRMLPWTQMQSICKWPHRRQNQGGQGGQVSNQFLWKGGQVYPCLLSFLTVHSSLGRALWAGESQNGCQCFKVPVLLLFDWLGNTYARSLQVGTCLHNIHNLWWSEATLELCNYEYHAV